MSQNKDLYNLNPIPNGRGFQITPLLNRYPLCLKQREAKQLETSQHFDKALICSCFDTIKKFLGILEKKQGHAKQAQKSNIQADLPHVEQGQIRKSSLLRRQKILICLILLNSILKILFFSSQMSLTLETNVNILCVKWIHISTWFISAQI